MDPGWLAWIESHPGLAGYVQTLGSFLVLAAAIAIPIWQRQTVERAAALELRPLLRDLHFALRVVLAMIPHEEWHDDGEQPSPEEFSKDLERIHRQLNRVSLHSLEPRCATLVRELNDALSEASTSIALYAEGALDLDGNQLDEYAARIYRLQLRIYEAAPATRDPDVAHEIIGLLSHIKQSQARQK